MTFEDIKKATEGLRTIDIRGKDYAQVNERVKAFRRLLPEGTIKTKVLSLEGGVVVMQAEIWDGDKLLADGIAYEREGSTNINKTSYIENCQTSAIGRALAFLGIGIDLSIASAEEVDNAIEAQELMQPIGEKDAGTLAKTLQSAGVNIDKLMEQYKVTRLMDLSGAQYADILAKLNRGKR